MSETTLDQQHEIRAAGRDLALGKKYVTADQTVVKIVEERKLLQDDDSVAMVWIGDNQVAYNQQPTSNNDDATINADSQQAQPQMQHDGKDLLLEIGSDISQARISEAFDHVKKAEEILNPVNVAVIVTPTSNRNELPQA